MLNWLRRMFYKRHEVPGVCQYAILSTGDAVECKTLTTTDGELLAYVYGKWQAVNHKTSYIERIVSVLPEGVPPPDCQTGIVP